MSTGRAAPPLLERESELRLLTDAWRRAAAGRGELWFLCAEAGGGKTRLAEEVADRVRARTLRGAAEPVDPPEPYLAFLHALPDLLPASERTETTARIITLLEEAAGGAPLLLLLDDLQFADSASVAVLVRLARECARRRWLILAGFRPGEWARALQVAVTETVAQGQAQRLDLAPLSREAVGALVAAVRGAAPPTHEIDALLADSGGNPWLVEALARGRGAVTTVRDRLLLRLDRVEAAVPGANAVLAALAPATRPLPHATVAALGGGDTPELRRALIGLRDAGILVETAAGWAFRHELLRRSLLGGMILSDQQDAHRALAEVLERGDGGAAELAMHFAEAGDARAVHWAVRAADEARRLDAHEEAFAQLERALRFRPEGEVRRRIGRMAALEAYHLGRYAEAQRLAEETLALPGDEPEVRSLLHQRAANAARLCGDVEGARRHMDEAERELEGRPVSYQMAYVATARLLQAVVAMQPERAEAAAARAECLAAELGPGPHATRIVAEVKANLVPSYLDQGNPAGFAMLEEVLALAGRSGGNPGDAISLLLSGYIGAVVSLFLAEADDLERRCAEALRRHALGWAPRAGVYRTLQLVQAARFDEARGALAALPEQAPDTPEYGAHVYAAVTLELRAGAPDRARTRLEATAPTAAFRASALIDLARL